MKGDSWLARMIGAVRSYTLGPLTLKDRELSRKLGWNTGPTSAGVAVDESSALTYAAIWQAVSLIAGDVGSLPLMFYKRRPDGGKERYTEHNLYSLLHDAPNREMTAMIFRETLQAHILTWGNAYAEIERDRAGRPVALWPLMPNLVAPFRDERGALQYRVASNGGDVLFDPSDILHIPGMGFDGCRGYSVIAQGRESFGLLAAAERFGATFFGNGSTFGGILTHPQVLKEDGQNTLRKSLDAVYKGPDKAHRFLILEEGMSYSKLGVDPDAAQFLETRQFQIAEVARWFNLPLHKLREMEHSSVRANIEQEALDYYTGTLRPWLTRWEQELNRKLVSPREKYIQFAEFRIEGALRGDLKSRYDAYAIGRNWGWLSVNEIRALENLNPVADGDVYLSPMNMIPADRLDEVIDKQVAPPPPPPPPAALPPAPEDDDEDDEAARAALVQQTAEALAHRAALEARHAEALADLTSTRDELEALRVAVAEAGDVYDGRVAADVAARTAELEARVAEAADLADAARRDAQAVKDAEADRLARLITAGRGVLVETIARLVRRSTDKARSKRATPEKFADWARAYYEAHEAAIWTDALAPVLAVHVAIVGDGHDCTATALVAAQFERCRREALAVAAVDPAEFQDTLTAMLARWETQIAAETADAYVREEIAHVRA